MADLSLSDETHTSTSNLIKEQDSTSVSIKNTKDNLIFSLHLSRRRLRMMNVLTQTYSKV